MRLKLRRISTNSYSPNISLTMRSAPFTSPTRTSILKIVSPMYCQLMVTAERVVSTTGVPLDIKAEKMRQARTMTAPSMQTPIDRIPVAVDGGLKTGALGLVPVEGVVDGCFQRGLFLVLGVVHALVQPVMHHKDFCVGH